MKKLLKNLLQKFWQFNRRIRHTSKYKSQIKNKDFTIFSMNCLGGLLYHDLGLRFSSPFINLYLDSEDFIKFCENPKKYLALDFAPCHNHPDRDYPVGTLGDIEVNFVHYKTLEEGVQKFKQRAQRINWSNIVIVATNRGGYNKELEERFNKLPYKKVLFTNVKDNNPNHFYISGYDDLPDIGLITEPCNRISGRRVYDAFDWVSFFNS